MKLTPCKLKEIVREEARKLRREDIGWDNLPDGWDEDSLDSFARSLTDKTQDDSEGFFTACMDEVEDKFDDPEAFCASLKDEYLGTTDWRGEESANKSGEVKLTESKLQKIVREEISRLTELGEPTKRQLGKVDRVEQTALTLSSPDAPPKVGGGEFYKSGSDYIFATMKYDKVFDSLNKASKWLKSNNWEVTGEKRKRY